MISIIIPVYNEEDTIGELLSYLEASDPNGKTEILLIDGGSTDGTRDVVKSKNARWIDSPVKGRAAQMNEGARHAEGDILYFLHADTYPPDTFADDIRQAVDQGWSAGCYRLTFDYEHPMLKCYSWFTRFDVDLFRFGDQSLFIKREIFVSIGGYSDQLIVMEDQEIVRSIKKVTSFRILDKNVVTSARKYLDIGIVRLQLVFTVIVCMFYLGVSQESLVRFYKKSLSCK